MATESWFCDMRRSHDSAISLWPTRVEGAYNAAVIAATAALTVFDKP
jgi:hypothetical protein